MMSPASPIVPFEPASRRRRANVSPAASRRAPGGDFSDPGSQRVLAAAALDLARELGRQAAREYFATLIVQPKRS
jgi:hypothetical protein